MDGGGTYRKSDLGETAERLLSLVARSHRLRSFLARMPPALRSAALVRLSAALQRRRPEGDTAPLTTNLGIASRLRVKLPADADALYLFGKPDLHRFERGALRLCAWLAPRSEIFVDIGSHRGLFLFLVAMRPGRGRVLFFEPEPSLFRDLEENVRANALPDVKGFPLAVGAATGTATFYLNRTDLTSSSLTRRFAEAHEVVPVSVEAISFRDVVAREGIRHALVKVDIEGAEEAFLEGARGAAHAISYLLIEVLGPAVRDGFVPRAARELGMHAYYVNELRLQHSPDGAFSYTPDQINWLFAREDPAALRAILAGSGLSVEG